MQQRFCGYSERDRLWPRVVASRLACLAVALSVSLPAARAELFQATLYDGTLQAVTPDNYVPAWLAYQGLGGVQTYDGSKLATNLDTTATDDIQRGYSSHTYSFANGYELVNGNFPLLDRVAGYSVAFRLEMLTEAHARAERAGFSVVVVGNDVASGTASSIEIGFQDGRVFAQSDDFGANVADANDLFNPVGGGFIDYLLMVQGDAYELFADGTSILAGALHDYTAFTGLIDPYEVPNFVFLGDDTTSANANINLQRVTVSVASVPEPASLGLMLAGLLALITIGLCGRRGLRSR